MKLITLLSPSKAAYQLALQARFQPLITVSSAVLLFLLALSACGGGSSTSGTNASSTSISDSDLSPAAQLGEQIFKDVSLSASGKMSCATCHDPAHAHAQNNNLAVQLGGPNLDIPGFRAVPSLRYLDTTPAFFFDKEGTPTGGFNRDGRAQSLAEQAQRPFLAPHEMANADIAGVVDKLKKASYVEAFRKVFGAEILDDTDAAMNRIQLALQTYQLEDKEFHPYNSKYDAFLAGKVKLTDSELRGLALFNSPSKGNCNACHVSTKGSDGKPPLFTDFTYDNLGVPRNDAIPATADSSYFDLGLCGPDRSDLTDQAAMCGAFKVPTLRNVATRKVFFHNGRFNTLRDALAFYVRRDTNPAEWYPTAADGTILKFNDLPSQFQNNVNVTEAPYNRLLGAEPALNASEIDDLIQFLNTLTDGYQP